MLFWSKTKSSFETLKYIEDVVKLQEPLETFYDEPPESIKIENISNEKKNLVSSFVKFLKKEIANNDISQNTKESIEIAVQCLETAFCLAPEQHLVLDLEEIFNNATKNVSYQ